MCGINGIFNRQGLSGAEEIIGRMSRSMVHRGPDADGSYFSENCAFGHRRLSIIDLNNRSNQPMWSSCGRYVMVYNGEVYNYREIAAKLIRDHGDADGFHLKTEGDSEIVLEAFARYGPGFVEQLNGMFAMAIYDTKEHELFMYRDRLGIKPLFYVYKDGLLAFASELKALVTLNGISEEINAGAVDAFLQLGFIPAPDTIYKDIRKLPAGTMLRISDREPDVITYWNIDEKLIDQPHDNIDKVTVQVSDLMISSVNYQLRSDVPFGVFLSGGIDSSLVTALSVMMSPTRINTFSIGFKEQRYNESVYARSVAEYLGTDHHEFTVTYKDALDLIGEFVGVYDEPFADSSGIPTMLVSRLARSKVTVTLSGEGGDELFFGYNSYRWAKRLGHPAASVLHAPASAAFSLMSSRLKRVGKLLQYTASDNLMKHILSQEQYMFTKQEAGRFIKQELRETSKDPQAEKLELSYEFYDRGYREGWIPRKLNRMEMQALYDLHVYLQDDLLTKVDRASMKYSLETRVPFLDHRIVEYAVNISPELKYKNGITKYVLKEILYQFLPQKYFERPKQGFSIPLAKWLRTDLRQLITEYLSESAILRAGLLEPGPVADLIRRFDSGEDYLYNRIWTMINLQMWRLRTI